MQEVLNSQGRTDCIAEVKRYFVPFVTNDWNNEKILVCFVECYILCRLADTWSHTG